MDVVGKSNHILAVPMLSLTLRWSAKLKGDPLAAGLTALLAECCQRLHMHFTQFIMDRVMHLACLQCCASYHVGSAAILCHLTGADNQCLSAYVFALECHASPAGCTSVKNRPNALLDDHVASCLYDVTPPCHKLG